MTGLRLHLAVLAVVVLLVGGAGFLLGRASADGGDPLVRVDTVYADAAAYEQRIAAVERERDGLRDRLAGWERRGPRTLVIYDTVLVPEPGEELSLPVAVTEGGRASLPGLVADTAGLRPREYAGVDVRDCDDGWTFSRGVLQCNRARLGHLTAYVRGGASIPLFTAEGWPRRLRPGEELRDAVGWDALQAAIGLRWERTYRSPHAVTLELRNDGSAALGAQLGLNIF